MTPPFAALQIVPLWAWAFPVLAYGGVMLSGRVLRVERRWAAVGGTALFFASLAAPFSCCFAPDWLFGHRHGPASITPGMTADEVEALLGPPDARIGSTGSERWVYHVNALAVPLDTFWVFFGPDGRVEHTYHPN